jgi:succinate dehydrogenase / fumarate reductase membrane anchor subunit
MSERQVRTPSLKTPLARVTGLGSAKDGTGHFWMQRLTAVALVPLTVWFVASLISLAGAEQAAIEAWLANPLAALLLVLFLGTGFYHLKLGLQTVIEDYIHAKAAKLALLIGNVFACVLLGGGSILAVLKLTLGA